MAKGVACRFEGFKIQVLGAKGLAVCGLGFRFLGFMV